MMNVTRFLAVLIFLIFAQASYAQCDAIPGFNKLGDYNGHGYYLSDVSVPWNQAKTLAENAGGYLATMNDQAENDFLKSNLNNNMVFIGYNDSEIEGLGQWADNEPITLDLSYGNTADNDYAVMNFWAGTWQMMNGLGYRKFVVEMECGTEPPSGICSFNTPLIVANDGRSYQIHSLVEGVDGYTFLLKGFAQNEEDSYVEFILDDENGQELSATSGIPSPNYSAVKTGALDIEFSASDGTGVLWAVTHSFTAFPDDYVLDLTTGYVGLYLDYEILDDGILAKGWVDAISPTLGSRKFSFIMKVDFQGALVFQNTIADDFPTIGFVYYGHAQDGGHYLVKRPYHYVLTKIDYLGNEVWSHQIGRPVGESKDGSNFYSIRYGALNEYSSIEQTGVGSGEITTIDNCGEGINVANFHHAQNYIIRAIPSAVGGVLVVYQHTEYDMANNLLFEALYMENYNGSLVSQWQKLVSNELAASFVSGEKYHDIGLDDGYLLATRHSDYSYHVRRITLDGDVLPSCSEGPDGGCDDVVIAGFTLLGEYNGHGYYLSDASVPWNQAKTLAENAGGYLATMNDQAENDFLKSNLDNNMVFIGYNDAVSENIGQWADNEPVTLDLSYGNTADNDYAVMNFWAGTWQMNNGLGYRKFVMETVCGSLPTGCLADGITFSRQGQVDSFSINYPGCHRVLGDVVIGGDALYSNAILNLEGLSNLTSIGGELSLGKNNQLSSLAGLNNLTSIDNGLNFWENNQLVDFSELSSIQTIGSLWVAANEQLVSLSGLENITSIDGSVTIRSNKKLTDLTGLNNLATIGGSLSASNAYLTSFVGLESLTSVGNELYFLLNSQLLDFSGLDNLTTVGGNLNILSNAYLESLSGFDNLASIGGRLYIKNNQLLEDISGIQNIDPNSINGAGFNDLQITGNPKLSECSVEAICGVLAISGSVIEIHNNLAGCNSVDEIDCSIQASCDVIAGFTKLGEHNGHGYYLSDASVPWNQAKTLAENAGGYLTTMNDQAENDFLKSNLDNNMVFIGYNDAVSENTGQWVDNEPVTLDLSYGNTTDNDYAVMNFWAGTWQMNNGLGYRKFVVEMDCGAAQPVPQNNSIVDGTIINDIYPNPAKDMITIRLTSKVESNSIFNIYDGRGQLLLSESRFLPQGPTEVNFDVSEWSRGVYFVKESKSNGYQKFVIMR